MKLFSYVVARDYGFAPNPFHGYCTLATCKPVIRSVAKIGDWVVGTGAKKKYKLTGHLIYAMKVAEIISFDDYWNDSRFWPKRPILNGSLKQIYGDNIYHRDAGAWLQTDSHHSLPDGSPSPGNIRVDTRVDRVLVATQFVYFGSAAIKLPEHLRNFAPTGEDMVCPRRNHVRLSPEFATAFEAWLEDLGRWDIQAMPLEFAKQQRRTRASG